MEIDFIYFDVGGVVILDYSKTDKWNEMMRDLGVKEEDLSQTDELYEENDGAYSAGKESIETFAGKLREKFHLDIPLKYSMLDDFVNRFEPNPKLVPLLIKLKKDYKLGLLTNTYTDMQDMLISRGLIPDIEWDVVIDSSKVGFSKPQKEIFQLATEKSGVNPQKILFIENTQKHINAAKKVGWQTILYDPSNVDSSNEKIVKFLGI